MERNCLRAMYPVLGISRNPINCMEQSASWKADSFSGSQENHDMGTEFGTLLPFFTGRCHRSLFWARWIQSISSHPISIRSILKFFSHLHLGPSDGLFCSVFPISALQAKPHTHTHTHPSILFFLIWSTWSYLMGNTNHETRHCAVSFILLSRPSS